ncbi:DUF5671 domain-containing protein [Arthrobacter sp. NPDC093139]|uniref:DUF5671 domain-containing protein n=1 Tax=Arthrobacter sp. NPDC093139 TaxID=3363945 RepID=UPI0038288D35
MSTVRPDTALPQHSALTTVRRLILFLLLFALVLIAASGLSGLLGRLFSSGTSLAEGDVGGLARSLAFALVGGTLAAMLWWAVWRRLREGGERAALSWSLYVAGVYAVALITFATALLGLASSLIGGEEPQWYSEAATGLVWALVWVWHRWMWLHPARGPRHLAGVPIVVGSVFGLLIGAGGAATALGNLLDAGLQGFTGTQSVGNPWWIPVLQPLVWAAGGAVLWWWHWIRGRGRFLTTGLANVALAVVGVLGGCILALSGAIASLYVLLRLAFDRSGPFPQLLEPLGPAVAAAAIGAMVWRYHAALAGHRPGAMRQAPRLLAAGAALVAAASGVGVVVNASLGLAETALAGTGLRTLLLGGLSALSVGGPVWWQTWDPLHPRHHQRIHERSLEPSEHRGQRIYLVVVFGISAVVALIALLVIGYLAFEHLLDASSGRGSLLGRVRTPLGLLTATGLVAAYHYGVWRRERAVPPSGEPSGEQAPRGGIGHVILVTASDPVPLSRAIRDASGAEVTVWQRADGGAAAAGSGTEPDPANLTAALNGISCARALVVVGRDGRIDVIPLADGAASGDGLPFDR